VHTTGGKQFVQISSKMYAMNGLLIPSYEHMKPLISLVNTL